MNFIVSLFAWQRLRLGILVAIFCCGISDENQAARWNVGGPSNLLVDTTGVGAVAELSGITYLGPSPTEGLHRFAAIQNVGGVLVTIDLGLSPTGTLLSATAVGSQTLSLSLDFEGIAFTNPARNSVFLAEEGSPGIREFNLADGSQLQNVAIPSVFANRRANRGFESLARSPDGRTMWTANEQALTADGPTSTASNGTTVRLLKLNVSEMNVSAAEQFAYEVDNIHGTSTLGSPQSGLSDLVSLPDGTLLALERSVAFTTPIYLSRIYEVDTAGATDVSNAPYASGLLGQTFTPAAKQLLWSGTVDNASGQNLEGLTLGPRLANGDWVLVGVVDDGDALSANTIAVFPLSSNPSSDFDSDGDVDGRDFLAWQRGFGKTLGALHADGDADRDGDVDGGDLAHWQVDFSTSSGTQALAVPEPASLAGWLLTIVYLVLHRRTALQSI